MPRKPAVVPNRHIHTTLPKDISDRVDLLLFSEAEGRVPQGAIQSLLVRLLREFFDHHQLDLAPFVGSLPGEHIIQANDHTLFVLSTLLKGESHGKSETSVHV